MAILSAPRPHSKESSCPLAAAARALRTAFAALDELAAQLGEQNNADAELEAMHLAYGVSLLHAALERLTAPPTLALHGEGRRQ
jgi:hypothetical protein